MIYRVFSVHVHVEGMYLHACMLHGDNPEALMGGLSHIQVDNHGNIVEVEVTHITRYFMLKCMIFCDLDL